MKRVAVAGLAVLFVLALSVPASAALSKAAGHGGQAPAGGDATLALLYDQTSSAAGNGAPDQDFEAAFNAYDSSAADDFVVTDPSGWTIQQVNTVGTTGTAGGSTVDVTFYANSPGGGDPDLPGAAECTYTNLVPTDTAGSFVITLPTSCILAPGTHWVGMYVHQSFGTNGQHFWSNRSVQTGSESVWRNPGDGFATGCTSWAPQTVCGVGGGASPDFLFQIHGVTGGLAADLSIDKTGSVSGGQITYAIAVTNNGPSAATNVVVTDTLPAQVSYVSNDCGGANTPPFTWNIGNLANAATVTCHVTVNVVTPGDISNTASVTATQSDPTPTNNSSTVRVVGGSVLQIPTLSTVGFAALAALLALAAFTLLRRRSQA